MPDETLGARLVTTNGKSSPTGVRGETSTGGSTELYTEHRHHEQCATAGGGGVLPCEVAPQFRIDIDPEGWRRRRDLLAEGAHRAGWGRRRDLLAEFAPRAVWNSDRTCWLTKDRTQVLDAVSKGGHPGQMCHYLPWEMLVESRGCFDVQEESPWVDRVPSPEIWR